MNVRKFFRYQLSYYRKELTAFYLIVIALFTFVTIVAGIVFSQNGAEIKTFSGMETMSLIFMFVCAAAAYKYHLHMGLQNSVEPKIHVYQQHGDQCNDCAADEYLRQSACNRVRSTFQ